MPVTMPVTEEGAKVRGAELAGLAAVAAEWTIRIERRLQEAEHTGVEAAPKDAT